MSDLYIPALTAFGLLILAVAWLPRIIEKLPLSLPIICVTAGWLLFSYSPVPIHLDLGTHNEVIERGTEFIVIVALMGAGLKLDRPFGLRQWSLTWRLLLVAMPLTIGAMALIGIHALGLGVAAAVLLGAALAPTDPVLASDVQVGPPKSGEEDEVRFSLTAEAGLNDGLAFPFVNLAIAIAAAAGLAGTGWGEWLKTDVLWKLSAGVMGGLVVGWTLGRVTFRVSHRAKLSTTGDGFVALGALMLAYGFTELIHGYGFLAVFVAAVTFRRAEPEHDFHHKMHDFMDQLERLLTMFALVLFGGALAGGLLRGLTWSEIGVALLLVFVVRPLAGYIAMIGTGRDPLEKRLIGFFGIRGIGTIYYLTYAFDEQPFAAQPELWRLCGFIILLSTVLHGATATPLMRALDLKMIQQRRAERRAARRGGTGHEGGALARS